MRRALLVALALLTVAITAGPAPAQTTTSELTLDLESGKTRAKNPTKTLLTNLDEADAIERLLAHPKVADWLGRYPPDPTTDASYVLETKAWKVSVWSGKAGMVASGRVDDATGRVLEAWAGPQVAWGMARGGPGGFGGRWINEYVVWIPLCFVFFLGLADLRRPLSLRNLDLLVLLSFSASLYFFNRGDIFTSAPLVYPALLYLMGRLVWIGVRGRSGRAVRPLWPVAVLAAATVFLTGFRIGLNVETSNVIDVGFAGVVGAHRIANGEMPYGNMPVESPNLTPCAPPDAEGVVHERMQTNGRCERSNERGDTYGPVSYLAYLPGFWIFGWGGLWDSLPAAHATSIAFDLLCLIGLALVGLRFGGRRLAVTLAFAWAAYPFTAYTLMSNTNDTILPAFLIWGFWLVTSPWARGTAIACAGWTKFAALILAPLWATYPNVANARRTLIRFAAAFVVATLVAFSILLLEPEGVINAARTFWDRTLGWQIGRDSPFSVWGWGQYHAAGIPDLAPVQLALELALLAAAGAVAFFPRRKSPLQLAALSAALLVGFELVLTHWFYLYIPWFFGFTAFAVLADQRRPPGERNVAPPQRDVEREPVAVG